MGKILLLDGFNLAFRSYYALPELTREDGFPTGAAHGWVKTLWRLEDAERPDQLAVFFDQGGSHRHLEALPDYKANRTEMPEALQQQLPVLRELTGMMGYPVISQEGVEADDLIASAARHLADQNNQVVIVSADKDLGQCVGGNITQLLPAPTANPRLGWRTLDAQGVEEKFGVPPSHVPDYLALVGDTSDNIPGVPGVGPKTAAKWIKEHGNLEAILSKAQDISPARFQNVLTENADRLRLNLKLVTLEFQHLPPPLERKPVDLPTLVTRLEELEMKQSATQAWERYGLGLG